MFEYFFCKGQMSSRSENVHMGQCFETMRKRRVKICCHVWRVEEGRAVSGGRGEEERGGVSKVRRGQEGAHSLVKAVFIL